MRSTDTNCVKIERLWHSTEEAVWQEALAGYWVLVKKMNRYEIESEMDALQPEDVRKYNADRWYNWLLTKYFVWKYTSPLFFATTTGHFKPYAEVIGKKLLLAIRDRLLECRDAEIQDALEVATHIKGLGPAGGSGLLALLFPDKFGTVDQFVVRALLKVQTLPEREQLLKMKPEGLTIKNAVVLIEIMSKKASDLNEKFNTSDWTPRKIDMVLWASD